jgi:RHS repeat-associated protein
VRVRRLHLTASAIALTLALGTTGFLAPGANQALETRDGAVDATLLSGGVDQWFTRTKGEDTDAVLTDALGSPVALGAADGTLRARYAYDPYGGSTVTGDVRGADLGFTGRQDDGTGLRYYRDRYYSPSLGRFVSEDPIGLAGGDNLYAYALNAPTVYTDPSGNSPLVVACIGGAAFGGGWSWAEQRLSGRKVDWGWSGVGGQAAAGCLMGGAQAAIAARLAGLARLDRGAGGATSGAESALSGAQSSQHLRQLEKYGQGGWKELESGQIRYYGAISPASKSGEMMGRRWCASRTRPQAPHEPDMRRWTATGLCASCAPRLAAPRSTTTSMSSATMEAPGEDCTP